jgi:hypothetical protein
MCHDVCSESELDKAQIVTCKRILVSMHVRRGLACHRGSTALCAGGTTWLQLGTTVRTIRSFVSSARGPLSGIMGDLGEIMIMASVALRYGGMPLSRLVRSLDPACDPRVIPDWCDTYLFPGPAGSLSASDFVVGTMPALSGHAANCSSSYFADPDRYASRGLLPGCAMGPGEHPVVQFNLYSMASFKLCSHLGLKTHWQVLGSRAGSESAFECRFGCCAFMFKFKFNTFSIQLQLCCACARVFSPCDVGQMVSLL